MALVAIHIADNEEYRKVLSVILEANDRVITEYDFAYITHGMRGPCGHMHLMTRITGGFKQFMTFFKTRLPNNIIWTNHDDTYALFEQYSIHVWSAPSLRHSIVIDRVTKNTYTETDVVEFLKKHTDPNELHETIFRSSATPWQMGAVRSAFHEYKTLQKACIPENITDNVFSIDNARIYMTCHKKKINRVYEHARGISFHT